ncbi:hypothetical protein ACFZAE_13550 [Streptomyces scabiei]|uniref:hypothetical protein n=1 Tax=Streptomyces TaxID=1883 RepID=UPI001C27410E|nr:hypothetical protein [Streptomyces sp. AC495_CC817]
MRKSLRTVAAVNSSSTFSPPLFPASRALAVADPAVVPLLSSPAPQPVSTAANANAATATPAPCIRLASALTHVTRSVAHDLFLGRTGATR